MFRGSTGPAALESGGRPTCWSLVSPLHGSSATIDVTFDPARRLIRAEMSGMLTVDHVEAFFRAEQEAVRAMGLNSGHFFLLVETKGNFVQSQEVMEVFQRIILNAPMKAKRIAIVRYGALPAMQTRRVSKLREGIQVFDAVEAAEAWLFDEAAERA